MPIGIPFALALSFAAAALAQDEGYPPGTLVPEVDLGLQPTPLIVPQPFRGAVPQDLVLNLPPGFSARVFAHEGLRKPRFMAFDPNGVLHVANMGAGQIVALPDRDRDGIADERIVSLRGLEEAHSLLFYKGALYVAEEHQVIRVRDTDAGYEKVLPITRQDSLLAATQKRPVALVPAHYAPMGLHYRLRTGEQVQVRKLLLLH